MSCFAVGTLCFLVDISKKTNSQCSGIEFKNPVSYDVLGVDCVPVSQYLQTEMVLPCPKRTPISQFYWPRANHVTLRKTLPNMMINIGSRFTAPVFMSILCPSLLLIWCKNCWHSSRTVILHNIFAAFILEQLILGDSDMAIQQQVG
mgnify:CR=1 FL=1